MKKSIIVLLFFVLVVNLSAQNADSLLAEGEKYMKEFNYDKALAVYKEAAEESPDNWKVHALLSRAYAEVAEEMPEETDEQKEAQEDMYKTALSHAEKAVSLKPDEALAYLRRAIVNGRIALYKGVFSVGETVGKVRDDAHKSIALANGGEDNLGLAYYVLARTHAKVSEKWKPARSVLGLGWADIDSAMIYYEKAEEHYPKMMMIHLDYAKALIREDEYEKAREELNKAINSPILDDDDPQRIEEAKELLEEIKDE